MPITRPLRIEQRSARVAGVDGGVGLDDVRDREAAGGVDLTPERRHDAGGHGALEAQGIADGHNGIAHLSLRGVAEGDGPQAVDRARVDLQHRQVGVRIDSLDLGIDRVAAFLE
jgi:hypothetical protein